MLTAASLTAVSLALAAGPGNEPPPGPNHSIRPCPIGLVLHDPQLYCVIEVSPAVEPTFQPAGTAVAWESGAMTDQLWVWRGTLIGAPYSGHTVVVLPIGSVVSIHLYHGGGLFGPWLNGHTVRPGDWNLDGQVNSDDISAFLRDWLAAPQGHQAITGEVSRGDYNLDGWVNSADISAFLEGWLASL
ncbi:dockerin type I domain-containing protein [uncultured Thermomonospora sp.]|uniref:dockerin type I domain-containing protein n=1 Tax=uncultured Thermomonospora sp. TaxID=671175 RepID=UPI00259AF18E|nr:dockerin type I domain-containing protein [uncultured Thermomonospora sp.]